MKLIYIIDQSGKIFFEFEKKNWANTFRRMFFYLTLSYN